jgi:hypothetical protein
MRTSLRFQHDTAFYSRPQKEYSRIHYNLVSLHVSPVTPLCCLSYRNHGNSTSQTRRQYYPFAAGQGSPFWDTGNWERLIIYKHNELRFRIEVILLQIILHPVTPYENILLNIVLTRKEGCSKWHVIWLKYSCY